MATQQQLQPIFAQLDAAGAHLSRARHCGNFTDRSDPELHEFQRMQWEAVTAAEALGIRETDLYRLYNNSLD